VFAHVQGRDELCPYRFWNEEAVAVDIKKYYNVTGLMALIASPLAVSAGLMFIVFMPLSVIALALVWVLYAKFAKLPENASKIFLPVFIVFCYYMLVWIIAFGLSGYHYGSGLFKGVFLPLTAPFFIANAILSLAGVDYGAFPAINAGITAITALTVVITCAVCKKKIVYDKPMIVYGSIIICLFGVVIFQQYDRSARILSDFSYGTERVQDEVNLYVYRPFANGNKLEKLPEPPAVSFRDNYPRLDGATAAYPVYAAMAQALYLGLDEDTAVRYVTCSNTDGAYTRLINGETDVFFGAQPSKQQMQAAKDKGVELRMTPISKEAFVFFVNRDNPVNGLTLGQIQDIYQKKITNWEAVGGKNERIMPFQRPENSGSQTIMLAAVMKDKPLPPPLWEEYAGMMGGMISQVAVYRNYSSAIGYSFRYFATKMDPNQNIKLLAVDGVQPSTENIRSGAYPFTINAYAVTAGSGDANTEKLIQWILSEQGQNFIEQCGYIRE